MLTVLIVAEECRVRISGRLAGLAAAVAVAAAVPAVFACSPNAAAGEPVLSGSRSVANSSTESAAPGTARVRSADLTDPHKKDIAMQVVSSAENSSLDWRAQYRYIEDIGDGRGYTA